MREEWLRILVALAIPTGIALATSFFARMSAFKIVSFVIMVIVTYMFVPHLLEPIQSENSTVTAPENASLEPEPVAEVISEPIVDPESQKDVFGTGLLDTGDLFRID